MSKQSFFQTLQKEIERIDSVATSKRHERIISGFNQGKAIIGDQEYLVFNSNDYLGLRHHPQVHKAEVAAGKQYGAGPGAVRFISGSLQVHRDLEVSLAKFHGRDDAMIFSSAFAANLAVLFCMLAGQSKDSLVDSDVAVVSDALNHRSIIDGIRLANLSKEQRLVYEHRNAQDLKAKLKEASKNYNRAVVVTDGIFSMVGAQAPLALLRQVVDELDGEFNQGILLVVDDCHGVASCGTTGRGVEELEAAQADILVGTLGKGFGCDGGYVVADQVVIDYLRESAATYIYSNNISPATAGAALVAVKILGDKEGEKLLKTLAKNTQYFKGQMKQIGYKFAHESIHAIQPVLIGEPIKTKELVDFLFSRQILVTNISYPVVPAGRDEIRVQLSAVHSKKEVDELVVAFGEFEKF